MRARASGGPLQLAQLGYSSRALYRTLGEPGASPLRKTHAALEDAYGFSAEANPFAALLDLNPVLAAKEKAGTLITPLSLPPSEAERAAFTTEDCIRVAPTT